MIYAPSSNATQMQYKSPVPTLKTLKEVSYFCSIISKCLYSVRYFPLELVVEVSPQLKHPCEEGSQIINYKDSSTIE